MRLLLLIALLCACGSTRVGCPPLPADLAAHRDGCLQQVISPDARQYGPNPASITFTVTATNVSSTSCAGSPQLSCEGPALTVRDSGGRVAWERKRPPIACALLIRLLAPGESMSSTVSWPSPGIGQGLYAVESGDRTDLGRAYFEVC